MAGAGAEGQGRLEDAAAASLPDNPQLRLHYMGDAGPNEFLLRLSKDAGTRCRPNSPANSA